MVSSSQIMDNQRQQQYIPGPPPPQQGSMSHLPPPPPRTYGQSAGLPPPPPGPHPSTLPPGTVFGIPGGWQQSWGRPGMNQGLPPPPPLNPLQLHNQGRGYGSISAGTMIPPPPPPLQNDQPVLSATFIPGGDSFGPGVGIPPFEDYSSGTFLGYHDIYTSPPASHSTEALNRENRSGSAASNRGPPPLALNDTSPVSPGPPTATMRNPQITGANQGGNQAGNRQRAQSAVTGHATSELAAQWPLDRIVLWLVANGFSSQWQEAFRLLNYEGADFLELGRGGRGFSSRMHQNVYPALQEICKKHGMLYDQSRERDEAKRLRKLVGRLVDGSDGSASAGPGHRRRESGMLPSASTDGNLEGSPHLSTAPFIATPTTAGTDDSPGRQMPPTLANNFGPRGSHGRSSTVPVYKQANSASTPNDSRHPDSFAGRSDHRAVLNGLGGRGRHSPAVSSDGPQGLGLQQIDGSPGGSPLPGHAVPIPVSSAPNLSPNRPEHTKSSSIDSVNGYVSRNANPSVGTVGSGRFYENHNRRDVQDHTRPATLDGQRTYSNDGSGKEHSKGFLSKLRRGKKLDPNFDDSALESPTSPGYRSMMPNLPFSGKSANSSDTALAQRPGSSFDGERPILTSRRSTQNSRRYIFVTPDHWNYRLIDITDQESAIAIRSIICIELGVADAEYAQIYVTEPGTTEHDEPLNDKMLVAMRSQADALGGLKFYVQSPNLSAISAPQAAAFGLGINGKLPGNQGEPMVKSNSAGGITREQSQHVSEFKSPEALQKAAEQWHQDAKRKQQEYLEQRRAKREANRPSSITIKSDRFVDFDSPRNSPYEDKTQTLVPMRKPPTAPSESSTLTKVNSLRKPGEKNRTSIDALKRISDPILEEKERTRNRTSGGPSPASGIGAALANVGKIAGVPASAGSKQPRTGSNDQGGSPSPEFTWSKGNMLFKVPTYDAASRNWPQADDKAVQASGLSVQQLQQRDPSPVSPSDGGLFAKPLQPRVPMHPRVKSYGPQYDFQEPIVNFTQSIQEDDNGSDDDSDDGLFAIPLANKSANKGTPLQDATSREQRPNLTVDTDQKAKKTRSVVIKSPASSGPSANMAGEDSAVPSEISTFNRRFSDDSASVSGSAVSPVSDRKGVRDSFVSDNWANRPAVENVVDHLDMFFPGVDLDKPYLEEDADGGSPYDVSSAEGGPATLRHRMAFTGDTMSSVNSYNRSESDTLGSDESTLKESNKSKVTSVAQRQISKAGNGLGRMKSVREVAKRRNEISRGPSVATRSEAQKATNLIRRKSTKMFGANIVQIKPKPGNRLSTLDPIPQEDIPSDETPKRQATFKIIRGQLIGKGTYGRVYLGMNATTGEFLAVKQVEVNQKAAGSDRDRIKEMVAALDVEIDTMQHLEHANIVQYLGCERKEFSISIFLEYISGGSIGSCLRKHGKFEEPVVRSLTQQTLKGLAYLHDEMILHRDLKADNILLDLDGTCKISDFGISKKSKDIYINDKSNSMQGSVFWMAPEVVRAQGQGYSAKVDIWSLGCVVLEMFAGKRPWSRDEAIGAIFKLGKLNQAPPIPEDVASTASVDGLNFMYDCFQVNPADRPTAKTLLDHSTFCISDPYYNFYDTNLAAKLRTSEVAPTGL